MPDVDVAAESPQKATTAHARARARVDGGDDGEGGAQETVINMAEIEAVALSIETGTPAPNETIAQIIAAHPRIRRLVIATAVRALGATKWYYDNRRKRRVIEPDYALSFRSCEFLADRGDGRPAQALLSVNVNATPNDRNCEPENWSPAMIEAMERTLERIKRLAVPKEKRAEPLVAAE